MRTIGHQLLGLKKGLSLCSQPTQPLTQGLSERRRDQTAGRSHEDRVPIDVADLPEQPAHGRSAHSPPFGSTADTAFHEQRIQREEETKAPKFQERFF